MLKQTLLLFTLCLNFVYGQKNDTVKLIVNYSYRFMPDTSSRDVFVTENTLLFVGNTSSLYTGYETYLYDSALQAKIEARKNGILHSSINPGINLKNPLASKVIKQNNENKFYTVERFYKDFLAEEVIDKINWTIYGDTKKIDDFLCQRATCRFRGRTYEAWFSPQLPFADGPWKLGQLPGLILDAHDNKGEVYFGFNGFLKVSDKTPLIHLPDNTINVSQSEFKNLKQAFLEDPVSFFENTPGLVSGTLSGGVMHGSAVGQIRPKRKLNNNRLELKD